MMLKKPLLVICFISLTLPLVGLAEFISLTNSPSIKKITTQEVISDSSTVIGSKVMLQAFYWDVPQYTWYNTINETLPEINASGFDSIWLPPPSKAQSGGNSMGYDPYDYYDLGEFNQKGSIATRFGVKSHLISLLNHSRSLGLSVIGDLVLNHNSGGNQEFNPNTNSSTYTDFSTVVSTKFLRGYNDFHPSTFETSDEGIFGGFPDLCHANPYVNESLLQWGEWLRDDIGYSGWRFDYVKGYHASMVEDWMDIVGGWGVAEFWDGNKDLIFDYLDSTGNTVSAFDFPLYYTLRDFCNGDGSYDMRNLANPVYLGVMGNRPLQSVTFIANHDTDEIVNNKMMAYAFILTSEGYPSIFWRDWRNPALKIPINTLIDIHNQFAKGSTTILYSDENFYIAQRNGDPGCIIALNDGTEWRGEYIQSKWVNSTLSDYTGHAIDEETNSEGWTEIWAPPKGYTVYSVNETTAPYQETTTTTTTSTTQIPTSESTYSPNPTTTEKNLTTSEISTENDSSGILIFEVLLILSVIILRRKVSRKRK